MVTTKHCCYGTCRSDSRYSHRDHMKNVFFIPFPRPNVDKGKCQRWVTACKRQNFTIGSITKDTYICSLHFLGARGPTEAHPDPLPATATDAQVEKIAKKRKLPKPRCTAKPKKQLKLDTAEAAEALVQLSASTSVSSSEGEPKQAVPAPSSAGYGPRADPSDQPGTSTQGCQGVPMSDGVCTVETGCQTNKRLQWPLYLRLKLENNSLKRELRNLKKKSNYFCVDDVKYSDKKCKFYTGLTWSQFMCLWNFLGPAKEKLSHWNSPLKSAEKSPSNRPGVKRKLSPINELFLTLVRLRTGLLHEDLAYRFGIASSSVSTIVITWIQFLYKQFSTLRNSMFPDRGTIAKTLPPSFKKYKGIRVIIDCSEFFVEQASNFERQGNLYSSYKGNATYKVLIGIAPNGAITFVSDAYEGSISDVDIVKKSGFLDKLHPGDLVLADRGFTIKELLAKRGADLNIPPFLNGRTRFTAQEEIQTKQIARDRIHVERSIERIKKFRLLKKVIPLALQPVFSQMVFVAGCLVNFQEPLVH